MVFCNNNRYSIKTLYRNVTILILIDGFLQYNEYKGYAYDYLCHNPYFNRWFSAIVGNLPNYKNG